MYLRLNSLDRKTAGSMTKGTKTVLLITLIIVILLLLYLAEQWRLNNAESLSGSQESSGNSTSVVSGTARQDEDVDEQDISVIASNLDTPWELVFLPDQSFLVTERPGRLLHFTTDRQVIPVTGVMERGEGGLLGLALDPDFARNQTIYLYLTTNSKGQLVNQVQSYRLENNQLSEQRLVLDGIRAAANHDGGRLAFGPDGYLYVSSGDAEQSQLAQDTQSLNGKILRINKDGSIPADNPFGNAVYSYGHRNVQGLTWDEAGRLWATEHGRSGLASGLDEINLIVKGANYGWPEIQGNESRANMLTPAAHSGSTTTWAPSGALVYGDKLYFAGLRGESLYAAQLDGSRVTEVRAHLSQQYGRLRSLQLGPDGYFYILTNNRDGRGVPTADDDKIIRLNPAIFD